MQSTSYSVATTWLTDEKSRRPPVNEYAMRPKITLKPAPNRAPATMTVALAFVKRLRSTPTIAPK